MFLKKIKSNLSLFKINKIKSRKYFLLSAFFVCVSIFGILVNNKVIIAQIKNIYNDNSDQIAGLNSLISAVASNDIGGARFFSKGGSSLVNQKNVGGATALHIASREKNFEIATILIENGASVNVSDNEGWTPLMRAALSGSEEIVDLLLSKNADATALNSINESAIVHATTSDCDECLNIMFEKFNFIKLMDADSLKSQINDSFVIAQNHDNKVIQEILEKYLDQIVKMAKLAEANSVVAEDLSNISITKDENNLNLVTKNKGEASPQNPPVSGDALHKKIKSKFKLTSGNAGESSESTPGSYITIDAPNGKKGKFSLNKTEPKAEEKLPEKTFKPSDSNDVFLLNSKIDDKKVTEILKSNKFKFSQGPAGTSDKPKADSSVVKEKAVEKAAEASGIAPIPPIFNNFKLLRGPKGSVTVPAPSKAVEQGDSTSSKAPDQKTDQPTPTDPIAAPTSEVKKGFKFLQGPKS